MSNFSELTYKDLAERLAHYLSSALVSAQYSMTDETMHDALGLCDQVTQRKAAPVPPAGDVEVLGWALNDGDEHPIDITLQWGIAKHWPEYATPLVDRAHVTRLTAERDGLLAEVERLKNLPHGQILAESAGRHLLNSGAENFVGDVFTIEADDGTTKFEIVVTTQKVGAKSPGEVCNELQSKLTKARELFREVWEFSDRLPDDLRDRIHASLAQSTPAAKDGESGEPLCLLCLDKKTVLGPKHGDFVRDCPECCGEEG